MAGIAMKLASRLSKRDQDDDDETNKNENNSNNDGVGPFGEDYGDDYYDGWWWSPTGMAVRYTIIALVFAAILLYFVGGYAHATRRVRKGLPPKAYHAWMVRRYYRQPQQDAQYRQQVPSPPQAYAMSPYAQPPPPAYNPYTAPPPAYQPPEGATKALADQNFRHTYRAGEASQSIPPPGSTSHQ